MHVLCILLLVCSSVWATGPGQLKSPIKTDAQLRRLLTDKSSWRPKAADDAFECSWRPVAYEYAAEVQPFLKTAAWKAIWDGLELTTLCNQTFAPPSTSLLSSTATRDIWRTPLGKKRVVEKVGVKDGVEVYANAENGDDKNPGTQSSPVRTIPRALEVVRGSRVSSATAATIFLQGEAQFRLSSSIRLGADDSNLSFQGPATISGAQVLETQGAWVAYNVSGSGDCVQTSLVANANNIETCAGTPNCVNVSRMSAPELCQAACNASSICHSFTWHDSSYGPEWNQTCWFRLDAGWAPVEETHHFAGVKTRCPNVWKVQYTTPTTPIPSPTGLRIGDSLTRGIRARFPNANPEVDKYPNGWNNQKTNWHPHTPAPPSTYIDIPFNTTYPNGMFSDFRIGLGGACDRFERSESYWCQPGGRTAGETFFVRTPSGLDFTPSQLPNVGRWDTHATTRAHWWRGGHWFTLMAEIEGFNSTSLTWPNAQPSQGAEGDDTGQGWFVEGDQVVEVDYPNEFVLSTLSPWLYLFYNGSGVPPADLSIEYTAIPTLFELDGSPDAPVANISFSNLTLLNTAPTYMAPHGQPSGGDWGLATSGAITMRGGVDGVVVEDCLFTKLDGAAIYVDGFARGVVVRRNEFSWLGASAFAQWGVTEEASGLSGTQPRGTTFQENLAHEYGIVEKQTSAFFQALSAQSMVLRNIVFNAPRAHINFEDDFGGGHTFAENILWNSCLESQDHSAFNSWGRLFGVTDLRAPNSPLPLTNQMGPHNFIVAGGGANGGAFDNDDGSSFYNEFQNVGIYGGFKSDFDGHGKTAHDSVFLFSYVYGNTCANGGVPVDGELWTEGYYNNICVLGEAGAPYLRLSSCDVTSPTQYNYISGNNSIYAPSASVTVQCGTDYASLEDWVKAAGDRDKNTTVSDMPTNAVMMQWVRVALGM